MARQTSGFGPRPSPTPGGSTNHAGVDYSAPVGTPIYTNTPLTVVKSGVASGYGNAVYAKDANGNEYRFGHLESVPNLKPGQTIPAGGLVGNTGNSGVSSGPHLHYEIRKNGLPVDPNGVDPATGKPYTNAVGFEKGKTLDSSNAIPDGNRKPGAPPATPEPAKPKDKPTYREEQLNRMKELAKREQNPRPVGDDLVGLMPNKRHRGTVR